MLKAVRDYIVLPIDNSVLSLRTEQGRREMWRGIVQGVVAFIILCLGVAAIAAVAVVGAAIVLGAALLVLLIPFLSILVFFGIFSIFGSKD